MNETTARPARETERAQLVAELCHEVNRRYCQSLGDKSQRPWPNTPKNIQASATDGVLVMMDARDQRVPWPPGKSHENWLHFKLADGWTYGPEKDLEAKTHPCMVPYDQLPEEQRLKDTIFISVVNAALDMLERR